MKRTLLITVAVCALLTPPSSLHAAPTNTKRQTAQIRAMCQNKDARTMMIRELMSTKEGKQEMARMLAHDEEFRSFYETHIVNLG